MKKTIFIALFILFTSKVSFSQAITYFNSFLTGYWSSNLNWTNGVPDSSKIAIINNGLSFSCNVTTNSECLDLYHNSVTDNLIIDSEVSLLVHRNLFLISGSKFTLNGRIKIKKAIFYNNIRRIEIGGGVELNGKLELTETLFQN